MAKQREKESRVFRVSGLEPPRILDTWKRAKVESPPQDYTTTICAAEKEEDDGAVCCSRENVDPYVRARATSTAGVQNYCKAASACYDVCFRRGERFSLSLSNFYCLIPYYSFDVFFFLRRLIASLDKCFPGELSFGFPLEFE